MVDKERNRERSSVCNKLAFECWKILEPEVERIASELESNMEINHFLACLNNRLAVSVAMRFNVKQSPLVPEEK